MTKDLMAKKFSNGIVESLYEHSSNVYGRLSMIFDELGIESESMKKLMKITAVLHDIGKASEDFQKHIKNPENKGNGYILHNIIGAVVLDKIIREDYEEKKYLIKLVLYHHPVDQYCYEEAQKNDFGLDNSKLKKYLKIAEELLSIAGVKGEELLNNDIEDEEFDDLPIKYEYLGQDNSKIDANFLAAFFNLCLADVMANKTDEDVKKLIYRRNNIGLNDFVRPQNYDDRYDAQKDYAIKLHGFQESCFVCQTGFGKTLMGLMWAVAANDKKIFWVAPSNSIAEGVYQTLKKEINNTGLGKKLTIGLLLTNKWHNGDVNSDVVVTNIDNFSRSALKNDPASLKRSLTILQANVIFDEFHEYVQKDTPLMAFFQRIVSARRLCGTSRTLYLSATPVKYAIPRFDDYISIQNGNYITHSDNVIRNRKYFMAFIDSIKDIGKQKCEKTLIATNCVKEAQNAVRSGIATKTYHKRMLDSKLEALMKMVCKQYGKKRTSEGEFWSSTLLNTGVDLSFGSVVMLNPNPESAIQILGRVNRWNDELIHFVGIIDDLSNKSELCAIRNKYDDKLVRIWLNELRKNFGGKLFTFGELYDLREQFMGKNAKLIGEYAKECLRSSTKCLKNVKFRKVCSNALDDGIARIGNNDIRKNAGVDDFYCELKDKEGNWIQEMYRGSDIQLAFNRLTDEKIGRFAREMFKRIKETNKERKYYTRIKAAEQRSNKNVRDFIEEVKCIARDSSKPMPIPYYWRYDYELGLVEI